MRFKAVREKGPRGVPVCMQGLSIIENQFDSWEGKIMSCHSNGLSYWISEMEELMQKMMIMSNDVS